MSLRAASLLPALALTSLVRPRPDRACRRTSLVRVLANHVLAHGVLACSVLAYGVPVSSPRSRARRPRRRALSTLMATRPVHDRSDYTQQKRYIKRPVETKSLVLGTLTLTQINPTPYDAGAFFSASVPPVFVRGVRVPSLTSEESRYEYC